MDQIKSMTVLKKGSDVFGSTEKFVKWLNSYNFAINCKPINIWKDKEGLQIIHDELNRIEHGII